MARMPGDRYRNGSGRPNDIVAHLAQQGAIELAVPEAQPKPTTFLTFDGHEFGAPWPLPMIPILYWAFKARRGDEAACEMMKTFQWELKDRHGVSYWPMVEAPAAAVAVEPEHASERLGE